MEHAEKIKRQSIEKIAKRALQEVTDTLQVSIGHVEGWPHIQKTIDAAFNRVPHDPEPVTAIRYCRELVLHVASSHLASTERWRSVKSRLLGLMSDQHGAIYSVTQVMAENV